ncbi:MAG TPA: 3'(2'),5'-bisphosphate nucleotidase CysQ [Methylophilaceae bacterium]|nr:3'(2'),5'-bisphosphate nucleotidase CysQ [Methylophilaceae bacterium]
MTELHAWLPQVIAIARQAGDAIMEVYGGDIKVQRKLDRTPLTEADLAAHRVIEQGLRAMTPQIAVLSEESAVVPYAVRRGWQRYWLVDPLDGTREFIKRNGEFTVNIALIEQGKPVLGVVFAPDQNLLYYACRGNGAYKAIDDNLTMPIHARSLDLHRITVAGSRSHADERLQGFLRNLSAPELISLGSSLKICLVAEGKADVYPRLGPTSEWDTAAAQCVLEQAEGRLVDREGATLEYNSKESLLNPEFFACGATSHNWNQYLE